MIGHRFASILLLACLLLCGCSDPKQRGAKYLEHGKTLLQAGEYAKARVEFKNAVKALPADGDALYQLGLAEEALLDIPSAYLDFLHAYQEDPRHLGALAKLAGYALAGGQAEDTRGKVDALLAIAPENPDGRALDAALRLRAGDAPGAEKEARAVLATQPTNIIATSVLTGVKLASKDYASAATVVEDGVRRNPRDLSLLLLKAHVHATAGDYAGVEEAYQAIFRLMPNAVQFRLDLIQLYLAANRLDDAERSLRGAVAARPADWELKHQLVLFLSARRSTAAAEGEVRSEMKADPSREEPYFWLAELYAEHGKQGEAVTVLQQIATREAGKEPALHAQAALARIELGQGNKAEAERLSSLVLASRPSDREALYIRASLEYDRGDYPSAVGNLRLIARGGDGDREALRLLAEALLRQGYPDLAVDTLNELTELDPADLAARVRLSQLYDRQKNYSRALDLLEAVTHTDAAFAPGWVETARVATDAGNTALAHAAVETLRALPGQAQTADALSAFVENPHNQQPYLDWAKSALAKGHAEEAVAMLHRGGAAVPTDLRAPIAEADVLNEMGRFNESIPIYRSILDRDPTQELAANNFAALVADYRTDDAGLLAQAAQAMDRFKTSNKPEMLDTVAWVAYRQNRIADAQSAIDRAMAGLPTPPPAVRFHHGAILIKAGDVDSGRKELEKALEAVDQFPGRTEAEALLAQSAPALPRTKTQ